MAESCVNKCHLCGQAMERGYMFGARTAWSDTGYVWLPDGSPVPAIFTVGNIIKSGGVILSGPRYCGPPDFTVFLCRNCGKGSFDFDINLKE